ncbi:MAG: hypothetical protein AAB343_01980 [Patescibacteria group bacterium]
MKKRNNHTGLKASAGLAAMALGAYYLYGKSSASQKRAVKSWALKARAEVVDAIERTENINRASYDRAVKDISKKYAASQKLGNAEAKRLERELRAGWATVSKTVATHVKKTARKVKKAVK